MTEVLEIQAPKTVKAYMKQLEATVANEPDAIVTAQEVLDTLNTIAASKGKGRGVLAGIAVTDMTDEQLKKEIINSKSVLYKAEQRGANQEVIDRNKARVEAAVAERDARKALAAEAETTEAPAEEVYADVDASEL